MSDSERLTLADLQSCFTGLVPLALATVSAAGVPNVTLLSRAHQVDDERLALSNQFLSKTHRNLAEDPHACLLLVRPESLEEFRVRVVFEQTVRRGPVFDRLRDDLSMVAALTGMQSVFRLRAADIVRVTDIERVVVGHRGAAAPVTADELSPPEPTALGELSSRIARAGDLDTLVQVTLQGLTELLGYEHSLLLLLDEDGDRLFTIGSHGYEHEGVGSEVALGEGVAGLAAQRCEPIRARNLQQMQKYARNVRASFERAGELEESPAVPMPGLAEPASQVAVPAVSLGELVGVLLVESTEADRFDDDDVGVLTVVASLVASLVEHFRSEAFAGGADARVLSPADRTGSASASVSRVRHYLRDGSTFIDDDYLTKGVAGRILWSLLRQYSLEGRTDFTNRETRLDPTLELPDFRDNFESRLVLLKRRLDERDAPVRIEKTGRGRFRLVVDGALRLEAVESPQ